MGKASFGARLESNPALVTNYDSLGCGNVPQKAGSVHPPLSEGDRKYDADLAVDFPPEAVRRLK
jgi:hypothetical protein